MLTGGECDVVMLLCGGGVTWAPVGAPPLPLYGSKPTGVDVLHNKLGLLVALDVLLLLFDIAGTGGGDKEAVDFPLDI